jgi:hypothetical protein
LHKYLPMHSPERRLKRNYGKTTLRLTLATDAAGVGLWDMELDTKSVWATKKTRELFYFSRMKN